MLTALPIELRDANAFVAQLHRHHDPVYRDKFRVAAVEDGKVVGVVQVARPVSRMLDDGKTACIAVEYEETIHIRPPELTTMKAEREVTNDVCHLDSGHGDAEALH